MKVLGIIPARGGSKGVPGKNIRMLGGKPLIAHTIEAAQQSKKLSALTLSTDSEEIAQVCREYGVDVPGLRPEHLAGDTAKVQDAVRYLLDQREDSFDYILLLQPTAPFRLAQDIDAAIELAESTGAQSVVSFAEEETRHPYYMYTLKEDAAGHAAGVEPLFTYPPGTPRQAFPKMVYRNGAIYLASREFFEAENAFISKDVVPYVMPESRSINIDTEADFKLAEAALRPE